MSGYFISRPYSALSQTSSTSMETRGLQLVPRKIFINSEQQPEKFCSNEISTAKYSVITFFPRFLLEQFRRYANIFFLVIALLQQIPDVSPTGRYTTAMPFLIILFVSAIKEIFEDFKRRRMDVQVNNYKVSVLREEKWITTKWKDLKVGEIVRIEDGHVFPADLILLSSSEPQGMAYIETSSLDGETNLKIRQALPTTAENVSVAQLAKFQSEIECEQPNKNVSEFVGSLKIEQQALPLGIKEFLLRGAQLKNTRWIAGAIVYTGHDAKLLKNSNVAPLKRSNIEVMTNHRILFLFATLVVLSLISAIGAQIYNSYILNGAWYLGRTHSLDFAWNILTFFILYNNLIPISLQVTLEIVRFFQASYINQDLDMYDERSDTPANARTSNLNEELGQVKFLMTDKTGTLTRNVMKLKRCWVEGVNYGDDDSDQFSDTNLIQNMSSGHSSSENIREFLTMMSVCHTVVPENVDNVISYQASSPDEGALVRGAAAIGFEFYTRKPDSVTIRAIDRDIEYKVLNILEFTSERKRMGVVVRTEDHKIKLYVKGADNIIFDRLSKDFNKEMVQKCYEQLEEYASKGYRTLCFAMSDIDSDFYADWAKRFHEASVSLERREQKLADMAEEIENNLILVGASAIEDKLQEGVPETIRSLMKAGIRIWMLTGDKRETAINIAQSSALTTQHTHLLILDKKSYDETFSKLESFVGTSRQYIKDNVEFALVISGHALHHALIGEARRLFSELCMTCRAVICCRMTPIQKAEIVEMIKNIGDHIVLAVGDGANDVAMIQAASVGVGITGEEGLRAASASDYSIAQFRFLQKLLLVHGTWNLDRTVKVILYSFYKNITLYIIELWFALFSAFSGQTIFERWTIALFNVIFSSWPPVILGLFDRPLPEGILLRHTFLYEKFQMNSFNLKMFALWLFVSLWHSLLLFFLTYLFMFHEVVWSNGRVGGWLMLGNACYTYTVVTVCLKSLLECDSWNFVQIVFSLGSIVSWLVFLVIYSLIWPTIQIGTSSSFGSDMCGMAWIMLSSSTFWIGFIFIPTTTLLFDFIVKGIQTNFFMSSREKMVLLHRPTKRNRVCPDCPQNGRNNSYETELLEREPRQETINERPRREYGSIDRTYTSSPSRLNQVAPSCQEDAQSPQPSPPAEVFFTRTVRSASSPNTATYGAYFNQGASVSVSNDDENERRRYSTIERAKFIRSSLGRRQSSSTALEQQAMSGFAFSQEEDGAIGQSELVRNYDSTRKKPEGI